MSREAFKTLTKTYARRIIAHVHALPREALSRILGHQLLRGGTSVAVNDRASVRGRSSAGFFAKPEVVEEAGNGSLSRRELLAGADRIEAARLARLRPEEDEILALTVASIKTARLGT